MEGMIPRGEVHLIKFTPGFISTFPIQVFAFTCAQNVKCTFFPDSTSVTDFRGGQLFPIFNELKSNSQKRMNIVIGTAIGSAGLTYEIIAVFGYLTFGSRVRSTHGLFDFPTQTCLPGEREYHRNVSLDLALHRHRTACCRDTRHVLLPAASPPVQELPRQGFPFRFAE